MKICNVCLESRPLDQFKPRYARCRACSAAQRRERRDYSKENSKAAAREARKRYKASWKGQINYMKNSAAAVARSARWQKANPERARLNAIAGTLNRTRGLNPRITIDDVTSILADPCVYCTGKANCVDHVEPLKRGGQTVLANLVPACRPCNSSKHGKPLLVWMAQRVTLKSEIRQRVG